MRGELPIPDDARNLWESEDTTPEPWMREPYTRDPYWPDPYSA